MMYAVYRHWGNEVCSGDNLLFVTANKQLAEDTVALAELEQEEARSIPFPKWKDTKLYVDYGNEVTEYHAKVKSILTVDSEGIDDDFSYYFEEVEVR